AITRRSGDTWSMRGCSAGLTTCIAGLEGIPERRPQAEDGPELRGPSRTTRRCRGHARERPESALRRLQSWLGLPRARTKRRDRALLRCALASRAARGVRVAGLLQRAASD